MFLGHLRSAHGQHDRDDAGERLRYCRNGKRDRKHQCVQHHVALHHAEAEDDHADDDDAQAQLAAEIIQRALQRGLALLGLIHHRGDLTDLGVHAGRSDHGRTAPIRHQAAGEDHIFLIAEPAFSADAFHLLFHAFRFTGQRALIDLQGIRFHDAGVRTDHISCFQQQDIADDQICAGDLLLHAAADDTGARRRQLFQGIQRFLRLDGLHRAQNRIHRDDRQDDDRALQFTGDHADDGCYDQDQDKQILELRKKDHEGMRRFALLQRVGPVPG